MRLIKKALFFDHENKTCVASPIIALSGIGPKCLESVEKERLSPIKK